jgi:Universal stress protein family
VASAAGSARRPGAHLIVVGTDGSEHAAAAVEAAAEAAAAWTATVDVVGVHRFLAPEKPEGHRGRAGGGREAAGARPACACAPAPRRSGARPRRRRRRGELAAGRRQRGEPGKLARRLMGSVADLVAERSPCDVLIVRSSDLG